MKLPLTVSSCLPVTRTDGPSMWASVQNDPPPREPDYNSIEQLFCLPVTEHKDKGAAAPVKKEPKEVGVVSTRLEDRIGSDSAASHLCLCRLLSSIQRKTST